MKFRPFLICIVFFWSCGTQGPSPEIVTNNFFAAIKNQQWEEAKKCLMKDCLPVLDSILKTGFPKPSNDFSVIEAKKTNEGFTVNALIGVQRKPVWIPLKLENRAWKIDCNNDLLGGEDGIIANMIPGFFVAPPKLTVGYEKVAEQFLTALSADDSVTAMKLTTPATVSFLNHFFNKAGKARWKETFVTGSRLKEDLSTVFFVFRGDTNTHLINLKFDSDQWRVLCTPNTFSGQDKSILPDYTKLEYTWDGNYICPNSCVRAGHPGSCPNCFQTLQKEMIGHFKK